MSKHPQLKHRLIAVSIICTAYVISHLLVNSVFVGATPQLNSEYLASARDTVSRLFTRPGEYIASLLRQDQGTKPTPALTAQQPTVSPKPGDNSKPKNSVEIQTVGAETVVIFPEKAKYRYTGLINLGDGTQAQQWVLE